MENVTEETSNPFGMRVDGRAVYGYGDANADFHVVGESPYAHGGADTGVPFTDSLAGERIQSVLHEVGLLAESYADDPDAENLYLSYAHPKVTDGPPTDAGFADMERFLDAELRAINAHILLPVGDRALDYCLREHTSLARKLPSDAAALHARQVRGRGFLVVPVRDPEEWEAGDRERLLGTLRAILDSDYRQTKGVATTVG
ncbi:uracil-DNA glycosylase family protein [Halorarius halobius]|uniref:uracil-DNA glycosylase family protein n=1 Tax=Halorarius halobius TaxID=2962671 RepID=UPI0020CDE238|nr:uracil-DNA glycosylase family protein [Halorarius halobius]